MKKSTFAKLAITLALLFIALPLFGIWLIRTFNLSDGEQCCIIFPFTLLLFFGVVFLGMSSDYLKD